MENKQTVGEYVDISTLSLHPKNPRNNDLAVDEIANSIKRFGFTSPIVSNMDGVVLCGNTRLKASRKLGLDTVPVVFVDLSPTDQELLMIADNKLGERAEWNSEALAAMLSELQDAGENLDGLGFDDDELASLLDSISDSPDGDDDEDDFSVDEESQPISQIGEVYTLGDHRLFCGDSTSADNWAKLLDGDNVDMVYTDPPYGMFLNTDYSEMGEESKTYRRVIGDGDDFTPELITAIFDIFPKVKEAFLFGADYYAEHIPDKNAGSWIVWDKRITEELDRMYGSAFELCYSKTRHRREIARVTWAGVFGMGGDDQRTRVHPTQKPTKLAKWFFDRYGQSGDVVADFYGGSGSTLIACQQNGRFCRMMELDPFYCDVIRRRWRNYAIQNGLDIGDGIE